MDKMNEIIKKYSENFTILAYEFNLDYLPTIYMYSKNNSEDVNKNYNILLKNNDTYKCIIGTIYKYKDNDGIGTYDFGLSNKSLSETLFDKYNDALIFFFENLDSHYGFEIDDNENNNSYLFQDEYYNIDEKYIYTIDKSIKFDLIKLFIRYIQNKCHI